METGLHEQVDPEGEAQQQQERPPQQGARVAAPLDPLDVDHPTHRGPERPAPPNA
ncbi:hypothetical protein [Amycolatopsis sp. cmx-4-68]|uniref:hypothetical protein n=1 Tax=Amycolatopsis sp. cmx-4-68 TaxID=2790938 RepID=UPI00397E487A